MDPKSIANLDPLNLFHVYDVLLDLEEEFNIAPARGPVPFPAGNITAASEEIRRVLEREGLLENG